MVKSGSVDRDDLVHTLKNWMISSYCSQLTDQLFRRASRFNHLGISGFVQMHVLSMLQRQR